MEQIGMQKSVGEKGPQVGSKAAGKRSTTHEIDVIARRDEGEREQETQILGVGQDKHAQRMHKQQYDHRRDNDRRHVEHRL